MITMNHVSKRFGDGSAAAVDDLSMVVPDGETVALVGPSGCGKTTTMRMINRLIEPTEGRIMVAGEDVRKVDPVQFRRRIGYVIQQVGLFSHMTIAQNIGAVPKLLGWDASKIKRRNEELIELVGLDTSMLSRYPRQLSGGQRQRVGVARALAADPPVLLMDEPFGAIDPIARTRLQNEFRAILRRVKKTVVMVTHDIDEAVRLGDRIAIMRAGKIVQYDTPDTILSRPVDGFVENFVGADRALKRLSLFEARNVMSAPDEAVAKAQVSGDTDLRDALAAMIAADADRVDVVDEGTKVGTLTREAVFAV
ncbi:betaine/proline/choline family ABC transporter ATP-binding protein [Mesorhizobium sp. RP14(2022)]|uniref:Quaternary amine transport ATP-binding protein n=1 Tax=Mesorhizobium liriopis TaxID=2953882 RepID=A0ABT1C2C6_9HYPH|nr:betaine/proline/choline family ABC transporter ATP-binding protein [Mesorhizobium liriopis]MCO6048978.1 betaine/proline/choline family ABC transporter ATP-binding protein [Mesorhizobium liriopis]